MSIRPTPLRSPGARASCLRTVPNADEPIRVGRADLVTLTLVPWPLETSRGLLVVRPARVRDLGAVAQLHRRCSARSLLDRYRSGGRPPSAAVLDAELRNPLGVVALAPDDTIVATGSVGRDPAHGTRSARASLLVQDAWQRHGIGRELLAHLAGLALTAGFRELIAYPATAVPTAQRLMLEIGRTRMVPDHDAHLHTALPESATLGLGTVRRRLAG